MKKYICALFIIFTYTLYSQQIPFNVAFENLNFNNKQNIYFTESDTFIYNLKNGVIDDDFIYSDTNGVKVSGRYKYCHPSGKWVINYLDNKIKLRFTNDGIIHFNRVRKDKHNVFAGFGKLNISYTISHNTIIDTIIAKCPIRWGKISGELRETYTDSSTRAIYNYKKGKYHGIQTFFYDNKGYWQIEYKNGKPASNKTFYDTNGNEFRSIQLKELHQNSNVIAFYDPTDIIYNTKILLTLDSNFREYPLLSEKIIDSINKMYYYRNIITYKDYDLRNEDWGAHNRPNIWDITTDTILTKKNIIGIALTGNLIILHQDFLYRLQPLTAAYVVCYDFQNEKHYALTPWFYLPELMQRNLILPYGSILFYPYKIVNFPIDNLLDKDIIKNHSQALIPVSYIRFLKKLFY
ncbi:MAG: hypothetical protein PHT45_06570, partial [Bacteroidales bacterium]|nr:hypothetical protein [Bacteroidales bacterium]